MIYARRVQVAFSDITLQWKDFQSFTYIAPDINWHWRIRCVKPKRWLHSSLMELSTETSSATYTGRYEILVCKSPNYE